MHDPEGRGNRPRFRAPLRHRDAQSLSVAGFVGLQAFADALRDGDVRSRDVGNRGDKSIKLVEEAVDEKGEVEDEGEREEEGPAWLECDTHVDDDEE
jgi:hypothetical protein